MPTGLIRIYYYIPKLIHEYQYDFILYLNSVFYIDKYIIIVYILLIDKSNHLHNAIRKGVTIMNFLATYIEDYKEYYGTVNISINDVISTARKKKNTIMKDSSIGIILNDLLLSNVEPGKIFMLWINPDTQIVMINKTSTRNSDIEYIKPFNISPFEVDTLSAFAKIVRKRTATNNNQG